MFAYSKVRSPKRAISLELIVGVAIVRDGVLHVRRLLLNVLPLLGLLLADQVRPDNIIIRPVCQLVGVPPPPTTPSPTLCFIRCPQLDRVILTSIPIIQLWPVVCKEQIVYPTIQYLHILQLHCTNTYLDVAQVSNMYSKKDTTRSPPTMTAPYTKVVLFRDVLRSLLVM